MEGKFHDPENLGFSIKKKKEILYTKYTQYENREYKFQFVNQFKLLDYVYLWILQASSKIN